MSVVHGGVKFYKGSAAAARAYVEADRSRTDDYYLAEGTGMADRITATPAGVHLARAMDGVTYEKWVAGYDVETGLAKGRLRRDTQGMRFFEVVVNGPKSWSLAAALHPVVADAYDQAQQCAVEEILEWLGQNLTTRVGPRGRQVQVPVEQIEAAVIGHQTSRAGDPHRHIHLQINARVFAAGKWRGLHSFGLVGSIEAINGIGHAAVMCHPGLRDALANCGYTLNPESGEVEQLTAYAGDFSARTAQITRNADRYEAAWRSEHPGQEPDRRLRRCWDRLAWADGRPDKVVPRDGLAMDRQWIGELDDLGFVPPRHPVLDRSIILPGQIDRDTVAELALLRIGAKRSAWNAADLRGEVERIVAAANLVTSREVRRELVEDLTDRAVDGSVRLLERPDLPGHVRSLSSPRVLEVEEDLVARIARRAERPSHRLSLMPADFPGLDPGQLSVLNALAGIGDLLVIEGAAGAGKTTTLSRAHDLIDSLGRRLLVVTPTHKAAAVATEQIGAKALTAAALIYHYGYRWTKDGRWGRLPTELRGRPDPATGLGPYDVLLVDEAGMLDQDTGRALLTIADETGAQIALVGDRSQLPAVGRGGVLDLAHRWARPSQRLVIDTVHRFSDPEYAALSLQMRSGERSGEVFDALMRRGEIVVHHTEVERIAALTGVDGLIMADTNELVRDLNAAIRDKRITARLTRQTSRQHEAARAEVPTVTTAAGEVIGTGDQVATRRNDRGLKVSNRDRWTVIGVDPDGSLVARGPTGDRKLPADFVRQHVELAFATTVHGAQGETAPNAHLLVGDSTGASAAYVGMTRGRHRNVAHLVAGSLPEARAQWVDVFSRDRADLGPSHAAAAAREAIDRFGPAILTSPYPFRSVGLLGTSAPAPPPWEPRDPEHGRPGIG